jgi:hypothetical protein
MLSRKINTANTQNGRVGSKSNPIGMNFKGVKNVGKADEVDLGLTADEIIEMIELEDTEVALACGCGTNDLRNLYKNMGNLDDALGYIDKANHKSVKRYYELKERSK